MPSEYLPEIICSVGGLVIGGLIGSFITHRLTLNRESSNRRLDLKQFLGRWRHDIERVTGEDVVETYRVYLAGEREFSGYIEKMSGDFWLGWKFKLLCHPLRRLTDKDIHNRNGDCRNIIAIPIDQLLKWI